MRFNGEVVLVTGASRGLGAAFARYLGAEGAHVIVNSTGANNAGAAVTEEIIQQGGQATQIEMRAENAADLVNETVATAGGIHAIVHNAGFVRDKTVRKLSSEHWDEVMNIHLKSSFQLAQAAWPHFESQGMGRLVLISSSAGLYGNFGQANYAAAKMGMYGLCQTIALEGAASNIHCNCVAPFGATELNSTNMDDNFKALIKPEYIAPMVAYLAHADCQDSGQMFEACGGSFKQLRWERSQGLRLDTSEDMSLTKMAQGWSQVTDFSISEHPTQMREALRGLYEK